MADGPPSRAVAGPEAVAHDGQLVRGGAAREGFESPVDELDLVGGYMYMWVCSSGRADASSYVSCTCTCTGTCTGTCTEARLTQTQTLTRTLTLILALTCISKNSR